MLPLHRHWGKSGPCPGAVHNGNKNMARKPGTRSSGEFVLFDVIYEDGTQRSNRKVPARATIEQQDNEIARKSGVPAMAIKTIKRAGTK
jgi:hypothetical protein